jgi:hypothetical protein
MAMFSKIFPAACLVALRALSTDVRAAQQQVQELRHGLWSGADWQQADLSAIASGAPQPAGAASAYNALFNKNRVVYRGKDGHIHQLERQLESSQSVGCYLVSGWQHSDLSAIVTNDPPAFPAAGDPLGYYDENDLVPRVIYRGIDNHIHELRQEGGNWLQADLSAIVVNNPPAASAAGNAFGFAAPTGLPQIIYRGTDNHIHGLTLQGSWSQVDLSTNVTNRPPAYPAAGDPRAYISDMLRIVYRGFDGDIHELRYEPSQSSWLQADLSAIVSNNPPAFPMGGDPFPYWDIANLPRIPRVAYRGIDNHIHELRLQGSWLQADLSAIVNNNPPAPAAAGDPFATWIPKPPPPDQATLRILYRGEDSHVHELRLEEQQGQSPPPPQDGWFQADLSAIVTNDPPAPPSTDIPLFSYATVEPGPGNPPNNCAIFYRVLFISAP